MSRLYYITFAAMLLLGSVASDGALPEFTGIVKKATPAVVNISALRESPANRFQGEEVPDFFRRFFRDMPDQGPRPSVPATGSGFIISKEGHILTNNHVVEGAKEIVVALNDRRELVAEVIGTDPLSDLALLKIDAKDLPVVELGSSQSLQVGEWVLAIGSPFGFEHSVTAGIVSAKGRSLPGANDNYIPYIQSDVAINPGNSGGPLFNMDGKVVGINSQIFTRSGGFMGLSFAIPIDVAMEVVTQLKEKGSVSRGWLGVVIQLVDRDLAEAYGLDRPEGALISEVLADSPAEAGGLKEGDIILRFNGHKIDLSSDLPVVVGRTKAESEASILIVRDGKRETIEMTVGTLPDQVAQRGIGSGPGEPAFNRLGLQVTGLDDSDRRQLGVDQGRGVIVERVSRGPAMSSGIRQGDVITTLDNQWVHTVAEFEEMVAQLPVNVAVAVRIVREGRPQFLVVKIEE